MAVFYNQNNKNLEARCPDCGQFIKIWSDGFIQCLPCGFNTSMKEEGF